MARILITSGPTRQYIDPVRYLTNASSGRMGAALAEAAAGLGHEVVIVSGPVQVAYPPAARVVPVVSTEEMLGACREEFGTCDGLLAAAAPCDYRPQQIAVQKIAKSGQSWLLELVETPDIVATLAREKRPEQWLIGFALETQDQRVRALAKSVKKRCDWIVLNGPQAIDSDSNNVELLDRQGQVLGSWEGSKRDVANALLRLVHARFIEPRTRQ
jgi:phosphopantothenoylcysteine decarboxylase/phosphopantothenate--cysteine ligase